MRIVDLNILLYATNRDSTHHSAAKAWLEQAFSDDATIAIPWMVVLGFLRISTNARVFESPLTVAQAVAVVDSWFALPQMVALDPTGDHWPTLRTLLESTGTAGNLTTDAHLAALAIEHNAELCSTDADFARFPDLRWSNPLVSGRSR